MQVVATRGARQLALAGTPAPHGARVEEAEQAEAEKAKAEEAEVEAKAKAVVEEFVQEAVAKAKADAKRKAATDADDGGAGEAKRRKIMATVEDMQAPRG